MTDQNYTIPKGWKMTTLGDVEEIFTGRKDVNESNADGKYIFFSCSPETFRSDEYLRDDEAILIVGNGSYAGTVRYFSGKFDLYQRTYACILKNEKKGLFNQRFLFYFTKKYFEENFMGGSRGSSIPYIVRGDIENFEIPQLPLPEQHAIEAVLSSLDDKIELLCEQNKTLEATAQAIFKEWFVNFNFPGATGKMIDSELGEIPVGWMVGVLNHLCDKLASGGTPPTGTDEYWNGDINWFSTKELQDNYLFKSNKKITKKGLDNSSAKIFPKGTIVMAIYAAPTVGRLGILGVESTFNQAACGFVANEKISCNEFIYLFLFNSRDELNGLSNGAAQQNLNVGLVKNFKLVIPNESVMEIFKKVTRPIFEKRLNNSLQIQTLSTLRDTLLPKLMKGEIRVKSEKLKVKSL